MRKSLSGNITIETSIVFPIVIMIIASLIYFSFYIHDVITIKSFSYSAGVQNIEKDFDSFEKSVQEKIVCAPLFVLKADVSCSKGGTYYNIYIKSDSNGYIKWLEGLMGSNSYYQTIKVEKKISKEILYGYRAICDEFKEKTK